MQNAIAIFKSLFSYLFLFCIGGYVIFFQEKKEILNDIEKIFQEALALDMNNRVKETKAPFFFGPSEINPSENYEITVEDSVVAINKGEENKSLLIDEKIFFAMQTILHMENPIKVEELDSLFRLSLYNNGLRSQTAIKLTDNQKKQVQQSAEKLVGQYTFSTKERNLGIHDEITIQGFVRMSAFDIFLKAKLSLLVWGVVCLVVIMFVLFFIKNRRKKVSKATEYMPIDTVKPDKMDEIQPIKKSHLIRISENILFDSERGRISYHDSQVLELTEQPTLLFIAFLEAPDNFLSHEKVEKLIGGGGKDRRAQSIKRLRETLKPIPELSIENLWGAGYHLVYPLPTEKKDI